MRLWAIYQREIFTYFVSPMAYIILFVFLLMNGITFYFHLVSYNGILEIVLSGQFGGSFTFWFLCMLVPPLITMRAFCEEKRAGTYELLVTSGVGETLIVVGKFLAAWTFFMILWTFVLTFYVLLEWVGDLDWGMVVTGMGGLFLVGSLFCSLGIFTSTLTQNQLIAAILAMVGNLMILFLNFFRTFFKPGDFELRYFNYLSPHYHFTHDFNRGVFDYRYLVFYGSLTIFLLFLAVKSLERRRWW